MKRPNSQNMLVLRHLNEKGGLKPLDALRLYGVYRLAARIHDLRELGIDIRTLRYKNGHNKWRTRYVLD